MKNYLAALVLALLLPFNALALDCLGHNTTNCMKQGGGTWVVGGTLGIINGAVIDPSAMQYSSTMTGNPLVQSNYTDVTVSTGLTSASMTTIIGSAAGKTIYPNAGLTIMVSGTAATATALALECSDGRLIASWPIADLIDQKPVGVFASAAVPATLGAGLTRGCAASTALMLSNVGTNLTTTTHVYTQIPYNQSQQ
jgi:hypothetical protein